MKEQVPNFIRFAVLFCSLEKQVKEIMHKAFWDSLEENLKQDPPDFTHALIVIADLRKVIILCSYIIKNN